MNTFKISSEILSEICKINQFNIPKEGLLFFGIRGAITSLPNDQSFKVEQQLSLMTLNYINPRCTILQWDAPKASLAAFPASTVPNINAIKSALKQNGIGTNCLVTGFYKDYRKGWHKPNSDTGHPAFRQMEAHPIRRTIDDDDYDNDDRIDYQNPHDNIHCGWFQSLDSTNYSSAGCQVIMGYPQCKREGRNKNVGPWSAFHDTAYALGQQDQFPYVLINGLEIYNLATGDKPTEHKLRFGSSGPLVDKLQIQLKESNYYEGKIDGDFGQRTLRSVLEYQRKVFGPDGVDGIVGSLTAEQLGLYLKRSVQQEAMVGE